MTKSPQCAKKEESEPLWQLGEGYSRWREWQINTPYQESLFLQCVRQHEASVHGISDQEGVLRETKEMRSENGVRDCGRNTLLTLLGCIVQYKDSHLPYVRGRMMGTDSHFNRIILTAILGIPCSSRAEVWRPVRRLLLQSRVT